MIDIIIIVGAVSCVVGVVFASIRNKKKGGCNRCSGCPSSDKCGKKK